MTNDLTEPPANPFCKKMYIPPAAAQAMTISWYRAFDLKEYMMRSFGVLYPESTYSPRRGRITLEWSAMAPTYGALQADVPSEGKCQPIGQSPCHKPDAFWQPYSPQRLLIRSRAGGEVYRDKKYDADGKGEGEKDGEDEIAWGGSEREEMAEEKEDEYGDEGKGQECKSVRSD